MKNYFKHKLRSKNPAIVVGWVLLFAILITAFIALFGFVFQYLWNWLMPDIFGLTTITYWQGIGLIILAKIIFGGLGCDKDSSNSCDSTSSNKKKKSSTSDFSKWELYDAYWNEEGEAAYEAYKNRINNPSTDTPQEN
ncbi:MAG: hypothetical protein HWD85_06475 [Flavobacteriaceae bacterium]|nr:hypothetical protein [Flavobacteriaceae bacterium]